MTNVTSAHEKVTVLQSTCMEALDKHLPTKTVTFTNNVSLPNKKKKQGKGKENMQKTEDQPNGIC